MSKRVTYLIGGQIVQGFPAKREEVPEADVESIDAIVRGLDDSVLLLRDAVFMREGVVSEVPFMVVPRPQIAAVCYPHVEQMSLPEYVQEKLGKTPEEVAELMGLPKHFR